MSASQRKVDGVKGVYVDDPMGISNMDIMQSLFGAVWATSHTSEPEILGKESCQKVTHLGAALEILQTPWCAVGKLFLNQARYAHNVLCKREAQKPFAEYIMPGSPFHFDPAQRESEGQQEGAIHSRYCQQALGSLLWLVTRTLPDLA